MVIVNELLTTHTTHLAPHLLRSTSSAGTREIMNTDPAGIPIAEVDAADFEAGVLGSTLPVLVTFQAPWSQPCHTVEAVLERIAAERAGTVSILKVDADLHPDLSVWYDIQAIPTVVLFWGGCQRARVVGTASKERILDLLQGLPEREDPTAVAPKGRGESLRCGS